MNPRRVFLSGLLAGLIPGALVGGAYVRFTFPGNLLPYTSGLVETAGRLQSRHLLIVGHRDDFPHLAGHPGGCDGDGQCWSVLVYPCREKADAAADRLRRYVDSELMGTTLP